ncbi:MAG TPA: glycoside hydrolase family 38 C-terminal domain-containing protein, partial [Anaerolineales bacterium]|nr:glycoside hydrolase family 38 C-terminal domain-containing protein [Anaerolineales bacterium]
RGVNLPDKRLVMWQGSDGTKLPTYLFGQVGYVDFAAKIRHSCDRTHPFDPAKCTADFDHYIHEEMRVTPVKSILAFDGGDHQGWDQTVYSHLFNSVSGAEKDFDLIHSSLDRYLEQLAPQLDRIDTLIEGELREPARFACDKSYQWLIPGVLSSRVWIKQDNAECQTLLCQWAEPLASIVSAATGLAYPQGFLDVAWKWLIQNHPHDSICGCSIDQVHEDMKYRFSQSRAIAHRLTTEAIRTIGVSIEGSIQDQQLRVVVFNPLAQPINEPVDVTLQIPSDWPCFSEFFGFEKKPAFRIYDPEGKEIPYQRLAQSENRTKFRIRETKFPEAYKTHEVTVSLVLNLPALGYTTLMVQGASPTTDLDSNISANDFTRHVEVPGLASSECSMENEFLAVTIESNGTLTVRDKRTQQEYSRLLTLEDTADIGDGWYHGQAVNDQAVVSTASRSEIARVHNGPNLCTFRCRTPFIVPEEFDFSTMTRSERRTDLVVDHFISLRAGCARVEVSTTVFNTARDHRLRVLLPSDARLRPIRRTARLMWWNDRSVCEKIIICIGNWRLRLKAYPKTSTSIVMEKNTRLQVFRFTVRIVREIV